MKRNSIVVILLSLILVSCSQNSDPLHLKCMQHGSMIGVLTIFDTKLRKCFYFSSSGERKEVEYPEQIRSKFR